MSVHRANYSVAVMLVTTLFWLLYDGELLILVTESIMLMSFPVWKIGFEHLKSKQHNRTLTSASNLDIYIDIISIWTTVSLFPVRI